MIQYIYFVKCPNCEDEHFDFFDEAKEFALGCLSQKPVITQTEVCRNDFGECTDSADLGTVWSWEDMMGEGGYTEAEPTKSIFTKDDLKLMADGKDPEFDELDNSVDCEIEEISDRKPISENAIQDGGFRTDGYRTALACYDSDDFDINVEFGMQDEEEYEVEDQLYLLQPGQTVADLVVYLSRECGFTSIYVYGETSANRNEIRTATRFTTVPGTHDYRHYGTIEDRLVEECEKKDRKPIPEGTTIEQLVEEMEENEDTVECTWCEELFDKSECRKEVNLGWLCSRCEAAIKSRGETLTFKENNYWDFLDEDITAERSIEELVKDSINHLVNDLGKDSTSEDFVDDVILDIERNYDNFVPEKPENHRKWADAIASEVSRQLNNQPQLDEELETKTWICSFEGKEIGTVEAATEEEAGEKMQREYPEYPYGLYDGCFEVYPADEETITEASLSDIAAAANSEFGSDYNERDLLDYSGVEDEDIFDDMETPEEVSKELYAKRGLNAFGGKKKTTSKLEDLHDLGNEYDGGYPAETPEVSDSHLKLCPECGKESFDIETGICVECGFN